MKKKETKEKEKLNGEDLYDSLVWAATSALTGLGVYTLCNWGSVPFEICLFMGMWMSAMMSRILIFSK